MHSFVRCFLLLVMACSLVGLAFGTAFASTVLRLDLESLVANSDQIVVGRVAELTSKVEGDGRVYTSITIDIDETLKGEHQRRVVVRQIGGRSGDLATIVPGMPDFKPAEEVVLFLEHVTARKLPVITGMAQGKFHVALGPDESTRFVVPQLAKDLHLVKPTPLPPQEGLPKALGRLREVPADELYSTVVALDSFKEQVQAIVSDQHSTKDH
ncbi:MAG: hypothetical protein H0U74_16820 [Bradymonadaceae bacterium]|nr:hypothetical protein [Lujinxingiaceae bacterium]